MKKNININSPLQMSEHLKRMCKAMKKTLTASEKLSKPVPEGVSKEKYDSCVDQVKAKGDAKNAYAVCAASLKRSDVEEFDKLVKMWGSPMQRNLQQPKMQKQPAMAKPKGTAANPASRMDTGYGKVIVKNNEVNKNVSLNLPLGPKGSGAGSITIDDKDKNKKTSLVSVAPAPVAKDDKPHSPASPEDSAHDIVEEGKDLKSEAKNKSAEFIRKMLQHLRNKKEEGKSWDRSPENRAAGKDT